MSDETTKTVARLIRAARRSRGMTQSELAARVKLSRTSVVNIEAGRQGISVDVLVEIARAMQVPAADLLPPTDPQAESRPMVLPERVVYRLAHRTRRYLQFVEKLLASEIVGIDDKEKDIEQRDLRSIIPGE